jgi:hypothetical protein
VTVRFAPTAADYDGTGRERRPHEQRQYGVVTGQGILSAFATITGTATEQGAGALGGANIRSRWPDEVDDDG